MNNYLTRLLGAILIAMLVIGLQGCTQKAWFQGFVEGQKYQCAKRAGRERATCLEAINDDYDRYQMEREEYLQRKK
jgi:hypothetical protein